MKALISMLFLLFALQSFSQEIPKKAWKIIVHTSMNKSDNYKAMGQFLIDNDCTIEKNNAEFGTYSTGAVPVKKSTVVNYYSIVCKDSVVVITGLMNANMSIELYGVKADSGTDKISFSGGAGSLYKKSFNAMNELAIKIPNKRIEYIAD